jgi:hypothetical protein
LLPDKLAKMQQRAQLWHSFKGSVCVCMWN